MLVEFELALEVAPKGAVMAIRCQTDWEAVPSRASPLLEDWEPIGLERVLLTLCLGGTRSAQAQDMGGHRARKRRTEGGADAAVPLSGRGGWSNSGDAMTLSVGTRNYQMRNDTSIT